ncbi:MAG: hypothetical protein D6694_07365 [Gammaproteobacteria bacterium]|nr:MAG: hypothetical protein D6694_07365 [Gammaproteobacteria bacterium]
MPRYPDRKNIEQYLEGGKIWEVLDAIRSDSVLMPELPCRPADILELCKMVKYIALCKVVGAAAHRYYRRNINNGLPKNWEDGISDYQQDNLAVCNDRIITLDRLIRALRHLPIKCIIHAYYSRFGGFEFVRSASQRGVALPGNDTRAHSLALKEQYVSSIAHDLASEGVAPTAENILEIVVAVEEAKTGTDINHRTLKRWQAIIDRHLQCYQVMYPIALEEWYET